MNIKINDNYSIRQMILDDDIKKFAEVSGDRNPIHLNEEYAKKTIFKKRIAHGMLGASYISRVLGNDFPGRGTIYMSQTLQFLKPVYIGDILTISITVTDIDQEKHILKLKTECINQDKKIVIAGEATVKNDNVFIGKVEK